MKKILIFIFCSIFYATQIYSQNTNDAIAKKDSVSNKVKISVEDLFNMNVKANKIYESIDKGFLPEGLDMNFIDNDLQGMINYLTQINEGEKYESPVDKEIKRVKSDIKKARKDVADYRATLIKKRSKTTDSVATIKSTYASRKDSLLKKYNEDEAKFKTLLYEEANTGVKNWQNTPYSKINIVKLTNQCQVYKNFKTDKKLSKAAEKLEQLIAEQNLYKEGDDLLHNPFDKKRVQEILPSLRELRDKVKNKDVKSELKLCCQKLNDYEFTLELFEDFKKQIEVAAKDFTDAGEIDTFVKNSDKDIIDAIKLIPWLNEEFDNYVRKVKSNFY